MRRRIAERGAAAVEFAILLPVVLLIIGGIVDFGRFFFAKIELTNAAREGARAAVVTTGTPTPGPTDRVLAALPGVPAPSIAIAPICSTAGSTATVTVSVSASFDWMVLKPAMNIVGAGAALPATVGGKAAMRCGG
ncbi:TadE/TadG family type IV pilus assembly protein [Intrasporangium sp. DVR]|uniref:TadE/TadG family type IV pilus assembly protein n=1 Tax=Intrasporangium sp. DVR TaxID=3127867 RepID=UPI00313A7026